MGFASLRTSSLSSTYSWTSLAPLSVICSCSMLPFRWSDVCWEVRLIICCFWYKSQCLVCHRQATIGTSVYECNTINSILLLRTYINTSIIYLSSILISLLTSTLIRTFHRLCMMISSCAHLAWVRQARIIFPGPIGCLAIYFPVALSILTKNVFWLCLDFNLISVESEQLYEIWPYIESIHQQQL